MDFLILGSLEAESGGRCVPLGGRCEQNVLAKLVLNAGRVVPVRQLVDAVWDGDPPTTSGKQVRNAISRLRRTLGGAGAGDLIVTGGAGYRLAADGRTVDAQVFEAQVAAAGQAASEGRVAEAAGRLRSALALWRGPALAGLTGRDIESSAAAWDERRFAVQELYYGHELALERHREVLGELAGLAASTPFRENLVGQYMMALCRCGRQADALAVYRGTRELLAEQMGLDPGPDLQRLQQQILTADRGSSPRDAGRPAQSVPRQLPGRAEYLAGRKAQLAELNTFPDRASGHSQCLNGAPSSAAGPVSGTDVAPAGVLGAPAAGTVALLPAIRGVPQVRYSLPADTAAFTGRGGELEQITAGIAGATAAGGVVAVGAIDGMPGVGKTALAVHIARVLAEEFPDRQLFIDLHAHTPGHQPVEAEEALAGLLAATGVDPRHLPGDLDGRAAMWRDRMAGQRAVLVLDNAASSGQVAPLLPGGGCLVLVTSRRHLGDLPGAVTSVRLDVLLPREAAEMFTWLAPRAAADRNGVAEVVRLAGFLPLAICLLARVFARHPSWTMAHLTAETRTGLLTMAAEKESVAAAFEVSYRHLDRARQRLFRLLGVHQGEVIDGYAAAALAGIRLREAVRVLDGLHQEGLVTEAGHRRYGMHDLLRRYARDLAAAPALAAGSQRALGRLLDYYQDTSAQAGTSLARQVRPGPLPAVPATAEIPALEDADQALAWARADRTSLLACLDLAVRTGQHARVVALTAGLAALLWRDGPWAEAVSRHTAAVGAARRVSDRLGEANALTDLGTVLRLTGDHSAAAGTLEQALGIYRDLSNRLGQANALTELAVVRVMTGDFPGATRVLEDALGICRNLGNRLGEANALTDLGTVLRLTGDHGGAASVLEEALSIYRNLGNRLGQAIALLYLGIVREVTGDYRGASGVFEEALGIYRGLGNRLGQANALTDLGIVRRLTGDHHGAAGVLDEALGIYRGLGNRLGEANALLYLGIAREATGDYRGAADLLDEALGIYRGIGERLGEANALLYLGIAREATGDYRGAADLLDQALEIYRGIGNRQGETEALNEQGTLHCVQGDLAGAQECHQQALELARLLDSALDEARALAGLGRCAIAAGLTNEAKAVALLRQAYEIYRRIGAADAQKVLAELDALTPRESA